MVSIALITCIVFAKPLHCSGTYFYTCHPLNNHLISTHHSTGSMQSLQRGGLILHQYLWEGIVKEAGQSPAQSASAGTAGSQLAMAPDQGSRYWSWPDVSCICVLNHSRTPLLQTSCTTNVGLCHLIVQLWIQKHSLHLRVLEFRPYSCYSLPYYCCDCACVLLTLDYHQSVPLHWNSSTHATLISTHHSTGSTQSLQRGGVILCKYLRKGFGEEVGQSPAQSACAGTAGPQLAATPQQGSQ